MIYHLCQTCKLPIKDSNRCEHCNPDTTATEIQRLLDLVASRELEIAALKRAAQEQALQAMSDMAQADDALAKKDAAIARRRTAIEAALHEADRIMDMGFQSTVDAIVEH